MYIKFLKTDAKGGMIFMKSQIKSKKRVADHGEVFTAEREVNAMLDLVGAESCRIESTFFEPACGNGNFLSAIFERKMKTVAECYGDDPFQFELHAMQALSCIYGVDIQEDNVLESRVRLLSQFRKAYYSVFHGEPSYISIEAAKELLLLNIVAGNSLTCTTINGTPLKLSEWTLLDDGSFLRRDFSLAELVEGQDSESSRPSLAYNWFVQQCAIA